MSMLTLLKCLRAGTSILMFFWLCLLVWEFLVRFVWKEPDLSIMFNRDEW